MSPHWFPLETPCAAFLRSSAARRVLGSCLLIALNWVWSAPSVNAQAKLDPAVLKKVKAATVHIKVKFADDSSAEGSGILAGNYRGMIITNAHVVGMLDNDSPKPVSIEVTLNSGQPNAKTIPAKVGYVDGESDLALLAAASKDFPEYLSILPKGSQSLIETQELFVIGFPLGKQAGPNVTVTPTSVTSLRSENNNIKAVQVNGGIHPGNSGGPLVTTEGFVAGIAVAAYSGTQIHLAIPVEVLNSLLNGRIANSHYGVSYKDGNKIHIPVYFEKADPVGNMKAISIVTWTGKPGPTRPSTSGKPPEPLPEDSAVTAFEFKPDAKGVFRGEIVLDDGKDPKLAYWSRYLVDRGNTKSWYPGSMLTGRLGTPVDRKPATLKYQPVLDKTDIVAMTSDAAFRIREAGGEDFTLAMTLKGNLKENFSDQTKAGVWRKHLTYEGLDSTVLVNKKPPESPSSLAFLRTLKDLKLMASEIDVGKDGATLRNLADFSKVPKTSKDALASVSEQVQQSLDSLAVPLPATQLSPHGTWKGKQSFMLGALGLAVPTSADVTYTYEGAFARDNKQFAVITFEGDLKSAAPPPPPPPKKRGKVTPKPPAKPEPKVQGKVEGKVEISMDTGLISYATEKVKAELDLTGDDKPSKAIGTLNVTVRRMPPPAAKK